MWFTIFLLGYSICVPHHFHLITLATEPKVLSLVNFFMVNIWHKNWIVNKNGQIWNIGSNICAIFFEALPLLLRLRTNKRVFVCLFAYNGQFSHLSNFFLSVTWPFHLFLLLRYSLLFDTFLRDRSFWSKTDSSLGGSRPEEGSRQMFFWQNLMVPMFTITWLI